ncbi:MAG: hypothetical protein HQL32_10335 [Planctomycetes bacterium]|nr:hypothetical protein [Planctomycetota bacterium]
MSEEEAIQILEKSGDYKILKKLKSLDIQTTKDDGSLLGVIVDVETTGLNFDEDKIIELGMIVFRFNRDGQVLEVVEEVDMFEDPGISIPPEITKLTGITEEMVHGKKIYEQKVRDILSTSVLVIAHNAGFDRRFLEQRLSEFEKIHWACSQKQVPWKSEGFSGVKQEYIAYNFHFFYEAHRAIDDCRALLHIMTRELLESKLLVLKVLLENARKPSFKISALNAPFDKKDHLKKRGYRWDSENRYWATEVNEDELEAENQFLCDEIYISKDLSLPTKKITGIDRFSVRA